jgi:amino acid adenylation domain-containing protein
MEVAQPVIFAFEYALAMLLMKWGIKPKAMIGYSLGEYAAACVSGVFSLKDALELIVYRGQLIKELPPGIMLSVPLPKDEVKLLLNELLNEFSPKRGNSNTPGSEFLISLAIDNGPSCIVAGSVETMGAFESFMKEKKYLCMRIQTSHAIHSIMMEPILQRFEDKIKQMELNEPQIPYISNVTGDFITAREAADPGYWVRHLRETVQFDKGIDKLAKELDAIFIEVGPGRDLSTLMARHIDKNQSQHTLNLIRPSEKDISDTYFLVTKLGQMWLYGKSLDWGAFHRPEKRHRIPLPTYPFKRQDFQVEGGGDLGAMISKKFGGAGIGGSGDLAEWFHIPSWKRSLPPPHVEWQNRELSTWLVFMDESNLGLKLVRQLENHGQNIITVRPGPNYKKINDREYTVNPAEENHYTALFKELKKFEPFPATMIHLWNISSTAVDEGAELDIEVVEKLQDLGYYSLLNIAQSMGKLTITDEVRIMVVSNNVQDVFGENRLFPGKATAIGAVKGIPKEYVNIRLRSIDVTLPPQDSPKEKILVEQLIDEFVSDSIEPVIAYRDNLRWVEIYESLPMEDPKDKHMKFRLKENGVYLITGGFGGIGLALAEYLAQEVPGVKLILHKRSEFLPRDQWEQWLSEHEQDEKDGTGEKIKKIQHLEKLGAEVFIGYGEMSDLENIRQLITCGQERFGPINGVIHSAGIPDGAMIQVRNRENSERIFSPKVKGTLVLDKILKDADLDFVVLCSSIDSVIASAGQVGYCAANIFLNYYARYNARNGGPFTAAINWPRWQSLGMAVIQEALHKELKGVDLTGGLAIEDGAEAFRRIVENRAPQTAVTPSNLQAMVEMDYTVGTGALMAEFDADTMSETLYQRPELTSEYVAPGSEFEVQMAEIWQNLFGFEQVGIRDDFFELGGDSLKVVIAISKIHKKMNVEIPVSEFFNAPTIQALAHYVLQAEESVYASITPMEEKEYYSLSSTQRRLYFLMQMEPGNTAYNEAKIVMIKGKINRQKMEDTCRQLIRLYDVYRTSFHLVRGKLVQKVHPPEEIEFSMEYDDAGNEKKAQKLAEDSIIPFDLDQAPLLRVKLIKISEENHVLMVDMHHIITDKASDGIFVKAFLTLYQDEELPAPCLQYRDYTEWQNSEAQKAEIKSQEEFWLGMLAGDIPVLNLPTDYPRPEIQSFEGDGEHFFLEKQQAEALKSLAIKEDVTVYMLLLSIINIFLSKLSGQEDIIVGTPVAGRGREELQNMPGVFINTVVLRNYPAGEKTYHESLQEIRESTLKSFDNQDYHYEDLIDQVEVNRDPSRNPLFDVQFVLQNMEERPENFLDTEISTFKLVPFAVSKPFTKFDLIFEVEEAMDNYLFTLQYCTKLFRKETIQERFVPYFKNIADSVLRDGEQKLSEIEIITPKEKNQILFEFNDTVTGYPGGSSIHQLFEEQVERTPDKISVAAPHIQTAARSRNNGSNTISISYKELNRRSGQLAYLLKKKGVTADTIVGIMVERSLEMIIGILGILKASGAYLPIDPDYPEERKKYILKDSNAGVLLTHKDITPSPSTLTSTCRVSPTNLAYIIYTSGTTGRPKGTMILHKNVVRLLFNNKFQFDFTSSDTWTLFHSFAFDFSVWEMYGALLYGARLVVISRMIARDPREFLEVLTTQEVTVLNQTPAAFYNLSNMEMQRPGRTLKIRYVIFGGDVLNPFQLKPWKEKYPGTRLVNMFGITETTVHVTYKEIKENDIESGFSNIGRPIPTLSTYIFDRHLQLVPAGVAGEICVGGEGVCLGYLNRPELTGEKFVQIPYIKGERLYRSGDLGRYSGNGDIEYLARMDQQAQIRGYRVEPGEIEARLVESRMIREAVVIPLEDNKSLCAYIVPLSSDPASTSLVPRLREYLLLHLPEYMIPAYFVRLDRIPLTPNGKVDRKALPEPEVSVSTAGYVPPRSEYEGKLAAVWSDVLNIEEDKIGIDDDFFELGGHSFSAIQVVARANQAGLSLTLKQFFQHHTIAELSALVNFPGTAGSSTWLEEEMQIPDGGSLTEIVSISRDGDIPLSFSQHRCRMYQMDNPGITYYNVPSWFQIKGKLDINILRQSFNEIIRRHDILRTTFPGKNNTPIQVIMEQQEVDIGVTDLQNLPGPEQTRQLEKRIKEEVERPFDLVHGPLMRVTLVRLEEEAHVLGLVMHHMIVDFYSMIILAREFSIIYDAFLSGKPCPLPGLTIQYADFASWQHRYYTREILEDRLRYWEQWLAGKPPRLELPGDRPRPRVETYRRGTKRSQYSPDLVREIKKLAKQSGTSFFMTIMAAFMTSLYHYSGYEDLVVAFPILNRNPEVKTVIGMFTATLLLRIDMGGNPCFRELLDRVRRASLSALEKQDVPFEHLVKTLRPGWDLSSKPSYRVLLNTAPYYVEQAPGIAGLDITPLAGNVGDDNVMRHDLSLDIAQEKIPAGTNLYTEWRYKKDLFDAETIDRLADHFRYILEEMVKNPGKRVDDLIKD